MDNKIKKDNKHKNGYITDDTVNTVLEILYYFDKEAEIGNTVLHCAARHGDIRHIHEVLTECVNVDVNIRNAYGNTALIYASNYGHADIVDVLIKANADVNILNNFNSNALYLASENGHVEIVKLLLNAGINTHNVNEDNDTSLKCAERLGHTEIVNILTESGINT